MLMVALRLAFPVAALAAVDATDEPSGGAELTGGAELIAGDDPAGADAAGEDPAGADAAGAEPAAGAAEDDAPADDGVVVELELQAARARPPTRVTAASVMDFFTSTSMLSTPSACVPPGRTVLRWLQKTACNVVETRNLNHARAACCIRPRPSRPGLQP